VFGEGRAKREFNGKPINARLGEINKISFSRSVKENRKGGVKP